MYGPERPGVRPSRLQPIGEEGESRDDRVDKKATARCDEEQSGRGVEAQPPGLLGVHEYLPRRATPRRTHCAVELATMSYELSGKIFLPLIQSKQAQVAYNNNGANYSNREIRSP